MNPTIPGAQYRWQLPPIESALACEFGAAYALTPALMQVLINRGLTTKKALDAFLFTPREQVVYDAVLLKDAEKAVERILRAIKNNEKILIAGDYDVDGMTATALMLVCLVPLGARINYFLPHRITDGYGLSAKTVSRAAANGYTLIITVDNGITAYEAAHAALEKHIDLIVIDHHQPGAQLPPACAIVDPQQADCAYPYKDLAGVGVAFKVLSLLYAKLSKELPAKALELLLLGTIADVVPLTDENRFWVRCGLQQVNKQASYAFNLLRAQAQLQDKPVGALDIAFWLAPQLNALGRLEDPRQGVQFLIGAQVAELERIAVVLRELNQARKEIERIMLAEIEAEIAKGAIDVVHDRIIIASHAQWPAGVIGLVASRLTNKYQRPALLFHVGTDGMARGSARSIPGFDIVRALAENAHLLDHFGGHAGAAGLKLPVANLDALKQALEQAFMQQVPDFDPVPHLILDAQVQLTDLTGKFMDDCAYLEPFGHMNQAPIWHIREVTLLGEPRVLKEAHVKCKIFSHGVIKPVIFFNSPALYEHLNRCGDQPFDIAACAVENYWQGARSIELKGIDIAYKGCS